MAVKSKSEINSRVVIVTGSTRGIGFATAAEFLKHGDKVVVFCRHKEHVEEAVDELGKTANSSRARTDIMGLVADVRKPGDVREVLTRTRREFGRIDVLVNNAGIAIYKPIEETSEREWDNVLDTNLKSSFLFMRETVPLMRKQGSGIIVNISSGLGVEGQENFSAYCASKFGLVGLTQVVADETTGTGIKVYAILPGAVATQLHRDLFPDADFSDMMTPEHVASKIFKVAEGRRRSGSAIEVYY
jgi:3-oxoacyl-[acyl-carrier protein] reductase